VTGAGGGIDPATINPPDAIAALRSFPRRWRSALGIVADDPGAADLVRRRAGDSPSALEHAWSAAHLLASTDEHINRARRDDGPSLANGAAAEQPGELEEALDAIARHAPALATTLEGLPPDYWKRSATLGGREVTILSLAQGAVADAAGHLRGAEQALKAARGAR
jgi:hypothetical protein